MSNRQNYERIVRTAAEQADSAAADLVVTLRTISSHANTMASAPVDVIEPVHLATLETLLRRAHGELSRRDRARARRVGAEELWAITHEDRNE